jgi:hypothetical protein
MENHTIYHYDLLGVILALCFIASIANLYRLWLDYTRVINAKGIPHDKIGRFAEPAKPGYDEYDNENRKDKYQGDRDKNR